MQYHKYGLVFLMILLCSQLGFAQGPPITGDKPIMLGSNTWVVKSLTEIRKTAQGTFLKAPLMVHYLPTSNTLVGVHLPMVSYDYEEGGSRQSIGDIALLAKYQFYRKDEVGKTFRVVAKTLQTLGTGASIEEEISTGNYHGYYGIVAGYESIKYGVSNELGFQHTPMNDQNELRYKLGFGLPLLKPTYPVNQVNIFFEYQNSWFTSLNEFMMLYAQGIQYAKGRVTVEAAVQFPIIQTVSEEEQRVISLFLGSRFVF